MFNPLYNTPPTSTYCIILINPTTVIYFNCRKEGYFTLSCLELKKIGNIKDIEEEKKEISNKLKKRTLEKDSPLGYPINFKEINLS